MKTTTAQNKLFDIVDIKEYLTILIKRLWLVVFCFFLSMILMMLFVLKQRPVYRATSKVLLNTGTRIAPTEVMSEDMRTYYQTQLQIIQGRTILDRAASRLEMTPREVGRVLVRFEPGYLPGASIMALMVDSYDPDFSQRYAQVLAEAYIEFKEQQRTGAAEDALLVLGREVRRFGEELKQAQDKLFEFKRRNNEVLIEEQGNMAAGYLADLSHRLSQLQTERMLLEAQEPKLRHRSADEVAPILDALGGYSQVFVAPSPTPGEAPNAASVETPAGLGEDGVLSTVDTFLASFGAGQSSLHVLRRQKAGLMNDLLTASSLYKPQHPEFIRLNGLLEDVNRQIELETRLMLDQFRDKVEALKITENTMQEALNLWEVKALEAGKKSAEYMTLRNDVTRIESLYNVLLQRLQEIDVSSGLQTERASVFEDALVDPRPVAPKKLKLMVFAAVFGLGVGVLLVFFIEYIDDSIRFPEEVEEGLGLPFFGVIPAASWNQEDLRSHLLTQLDPKAGLAEAYRNVRSAILFNLPGAEPKSLVVTSSIPREGKTTTAINLAISFAQAGGSVLLVDCDLRRGSLHKYFGQEQDRGLCDVLGGRAKPEAVTRRSGVPNLDLLTTGQYPSNPAELLLSPEMKEFLAWASRVYDKVILDCPPAMAVSDAGIVGSMADACVFVVWAGQTSRRVAMAAKAILETRGARIVGCILNNLEFGRVGYYYYSTYYNYYDYGYRYEDQPGRPDEKAEAAGVGTTQA